MYLIITPSTTLPTVGNFNAMVQGFAPVYVESIQTIRLGSGQSKAQLTVRFLPPLSSSDGEFEIDPNGTPSGIRILSLID
jgi:hypothetical protein